MSLCVRLLYFVKLLMLVIFWIKASGSGVRYRPFVVRCQFNVETSGHRPTCILRAKMPTLGLSLHQV